MSVEERDPVCGMTVQSSTVEHVEHRGATYAFCASGCRERFLREPDRFLCPRESNEEVAHRAATYGRRWHQRLASARQSRGRYRHGHRHRRRNRECRSDARRGRPARSRSRARAERRHDAKHQAKPRFRPRLQRRWSADCCRCALSLHLMRLSPMLAAAAMSLSSVSVIANSLRLVAAPVAPALRTLRLQAED